MITNELRFIVLGPSGAGKTTLLASMHKMLTEVLPGAFSPGDAKTSDLLAQSYKVLENEANSSELSFGTAIANTEELREYMFTVNGHGKSVPARFVDFPGGWMNSESDSEEAQANYRRLVDLVQKSKVIFAVINMPYLMEYNGKYIERAGIDDMQKMFEISLQNDDQDRLILLVPIKCEKYTTTLQDGHAMRERVKEVFHKTIELTKDPAYKDRLALAIVPVRTIGNVQFSRFDFTDEKIASEIYWKQANSIFNPCDVDQPLRFALSFLLNQFEIPSNLRDAVESIQAGMRLNDENFDILSGISLISGEGVRKRIPLKARSEEQADVVSSSTPSANEPTPKVKSNAGNKYKIVVMGATGVGKTIFLGSYFNLVTVLGKGEYSIDPSSQKSARRITELIKQLFQEKKIVYGTSERVDFSFAIDKPKMDIELFDIPGGYTTDIDDWAREKIIPDLLQADGALFFISGEDIVNNPDRTWTDNMVFSKAISLIRENTGGEFQGRADVPIQFIITKGDTIPDVSEDDLKKRITSLIKKATSSSEFGSTLEKNFFKKGNYVKVYKSEAMGKWPSATALPEDYQPKNVTEPMDDLIKAMYKSRTIHRGIVRKLWACAAALVLILAWGGLYAWDHHNWSKAQEGLEQALRKADYPAAQTILENFHSPSLPFLYPRFVRADSKVSEEYAKYEAALYSLIQADFAAFDEKSLPPRTKDFFDSAERMDQYLAVKNFAVIAPQHYEQVKNRKWYFDAGRLFNFDVTQAINSPDELLKIIRQCLELETPATWGNSVRARIDDLVQNWGNALPLNVKPDVLESYITTADALMSSPKLSDGLRAYLKKQEKIWDTAKDNRWTQTANEWIREAGSNPENAVKTLEARLMKSPSPVVTELIQKELEKDYSTLVAQWRDTYKSEKDIPRLNELMSEYSGMPQTSKETLRAHIRELDRIRLEKIVANLVRVRSMEELSREVGKLGADATTDTIQNAVNSIMRELMKTQLSQTREEIAGFRQDGRFGDGKKKVMDRCNVLRSNIRPLIGGQEDSPMLISVKEFEESLFRELSDAHLDACRHEFNRSKYTQNSGDIKECYDRLNEFLATWPDSDEVGTVKEVLTYLATIQNGVQGFIQILNGDFSEMFWIDKPDMYVEVWEGDKLLHKTGTVHGNDKPDFKGEQFIYTWKVDNSPLTFVATDSEYSWLGGKGEVLKQPVIVSGISGYKKLTTELTSKKDGKECSLRINFKPSTLIPECPWQ